MYRLSNSGINHESISLLIESLESGRKKKAEFDWFQFNDVQEYFKEKKGEGFFCSQFFIDGKKNYLIGFVSGGVFFTDCEACLMGFFVGEENGH